MIKRFKIYCFISGTILLNLFYSCKQNPDVVVPDFDVSVSKTTVAKGEPITFNFTGNANSIVFWAGDSSRNYEFRRRDTVSGGKPVFQFSTLRQFGFNPGVADTSLQLMVSNDFNGNINAVDLLLANWKNISDRAKLAVGASSTVYTASGPVDLSDIIPRDSAGVRTPIYVAFKYYDNETRTNKRAWNTKDYLIDYVFPDGSKVNIAGSTMTWGTVAVKNFLRTWFIYTGPSSSLMWGGDGSFPETEHWLISQPLFLNRVKPDMGLSVKTSPTTIQTDYTFPGYSKPGTYTAVFLATNANRWDLKTVEKRITITVQ